MPRLRRSDPSAPGIVRVRKGRGFRYVDKAGNEVTDEQTLARIDALVIPPAWEDVWISPHPNGHIQAIGTDAAKRRQYRYHEEWRQARALVKMFRDNFAKFEQHVDADVKAAAPGLQAAAE